MMDKKQEQQRPTKQAASSFTWPLLAVAAALVGNIVLNYVPAASLPREIYHPQVKIPQGTVVGRLVDDGTFAEPLEGFMGIPYALPPVGDRRFREAVPVPDSDEQIYAYFLGPR
jgi:acetylcholinesterase